MGLARPVSPLHDDESSVDADLARRLVAAEFPRWADRPLSSAGGGTDNTMFRLGTDLLLRFPRTPGTAAGLGKEQTWLPRLAPYLPLEIPRPVDRGAPAEGYPHPWAVYGWIEGVEPTVHTVEDWPSFGRDLAGFVGTLQSLDRMGTRRTGDLANYRGERFTDRPAWAYEVVDRCRNLSDLDVDLAHIQLILDAADTVGSPYLTPVWMHSDLRPANLLVRDGRLVAVLDFGGLALGDPTAEHAPLWDFPQPARDAYRQALGVDDAMWLRAAAWALLVGLTGMDYYRSSWPQFAAECRLRVHAVLADQSLVP